MRPQDIGFAATLGGVYLAVVLAMCASLDGCATQPAKLPAPTPVAACLPIKSYDAAQQKQAAAELANLPNGSVVAQMVIDYGALRDANRAACQSSK